MLMASAASTIPQRPLAILGKSMSELFVVVFGVVTGFICRSIANHKNRRPELWFVLGFLFGLLAVLVVAFLPTLPA